MYDSPLIAIEDDITGTVEYYRKTKLCAGLVGSNLMITLFGLLRGHRSNWKVIARYDDRDHAEACQEMLSDGGYWMQHRRNFRREVAVEDRVLCCARGMELLRDEPPVEADRQPPVMNAERMALITRVYGFEA